MGQKELSKRKRASCREYAECVAWRGVGGGGGGETIWEGTGREENPGGRGGRGRTCEEPRGGLGRMILGPSEPVDPWDTFGRGDTGKGLEPTPRHVSPLHAFPGGQFGVRPGQLRNQTLDGIGQTLRDASAFKDRNTRSVDNSARLGLCRTCPFAPCADPTPQPLGLSVWAASVACSLSLPSSLPLVAFCLELFHP